MTARPTKSGAGKGAEAKAGDGSVFLFYGNDEFRVAQAARAAVDRLCPAEEQVLGLEIIEGQASTADQAVQCLRQCLLAVRMPGLFGGRKVVWFREVSFLKGDKPGKVAAVQPWLTELVELIKHGLPPGQVLVVSAPAVDGRSAFAKACKERGAVEVFDAPERSYQQLPYAIEFAREAFHKAGLSFDPDVPQQLAERAGVDTRRIVQEVEKLALFIMPRQRVTGEDVRAIVPAECESAGWDLAEAICKVELPRALALFRQLLFQKEEPIGLVSFIEGRFRDLALVREALDHGWVRLNWKNAEWSQTAEVEEAFGALGTRDPRSKNPFIVGMMIEQARRFEARELDWCRAEVLKTREQMVSGGATPEMLLELLILKLLGRKAQAAKRTPA